MEDRNSQHSNTPGPHHSLSFHGPPARLDAWLALRRHDISRARWQHLIKEGRVRVNGLAAKPSRPLRSGDVVDYTLPPSRTVDLAPEPIPLDVLFEDGDLIVVNKPPGLVVHPAPGHPSGTLVNALLAHARDAATGRTNLGGIGGELRPGIVHRLDRDTSGALVAAKTERALHGLAAQFKGRRVRKEYAALVWGQPQPPSGTVETLIGRSPHNRKRMSARPAVGRPAVTRYETVERLGPVSLLRVRIETGRTHQIRVHLAHVGHPVVGDREYGRARAAALPAPAARQMLHAERLAFAHPVSGKDLEFTAPLPEDMKELIRALRAAESA